jgi:hypothetical protein
MGNRTLYVRDSDEGTWQKAEELVKGQGAESLSKLVTDALEKEMERLETVKEIKEGIEKIVLEIENEKGTRKIAFNGKWLIEDYEWDKSFISVALTEKESYFVFWDSQGNCKDDYEVFDYFDDFTNSDAIPEDLKSLVANEVGEDYVEFLDI